MSEETPKKLAFIDLALPRRICVRQGSDLVCYTIPVISQDAWFKYFDGIISTSVREGKQIVQHTDATSAALELVDSFSVISMLPEGAAIPLAHRLALANVLTSAYAPEDESLDGTMSPDSVRLHAIWSAGEGDAMRRYKNLVHCFEPPTAEQNRRYRRDDSRAQIIGGSRKGTTIYHGAQRTLAALYDELIVNVSGYAVDGVALDGRDQIVRHMDTYHKVAAAARLFAASEVVIEEEDEE